MRDLAVTEREIRQAIASGYRGFALTVDAIQVGKRERDMRLNIAEDAVSPVLVPDIRNSETKLLFRSGYSHRGG